MARYSAAFVFYVKLDLVGFGLRYNKTFGDLKVQLSGQLSRVENTVTDLNPKVDGGDLDRILYESRILGEGFPFLGYYVVKTDGLITGAPNAANASMGAQAGDINMIDFDGDNEITLDDRQYVGKDIPTYTYGFQLGLQLSLIHISEPTRLLSIGYCVIWV